MIDSPSSFYRLAIEIELSVLIVLVEISEEKTKEQQDFFDKQLYSKHVTF